MQEKELPQIPVEIPEPEKMPEITPDHVPESPEMPKEEPDNIPEEEPFITPPYEVPTPSETP